LDLILELLLFVQAVQGKGFELICREKAQKAQKNALLRSFG